MVCESCFLYVCRRLYTAGHAQSHHHLLAVTPAWMLASQLQFNASAGLIRPVYEVKMKSDNPGQQEREKKVIVMQFCAQGLDRQLFVLERDTAVFFFCLF